MIWFLLAKNTFLIKKKKLDDKLSIIIIKKLKNYFANETFSSSPCIICDVCEKKYHTNSNWPLRKSSNVISIITSIGLIINKNRKTNTKGPKKV